MPQQTPILYTFRRCPYAMRARMALKASEIKVEMREIVLRDKPAHMLEISPKGTVPVLQFGGADDPMGGVLEESVDIMYWALAENDPLGWLDLTPEETPVVAAILTQNDGFYKRALDQYKYPDRFKGQPGGLEDPKAEGLKFWQNLEDALEQNGGAFLLGDKQTVADVMTFPFVRQFANVDKTWFEGCDDFPRVKKWLNTHLESELFESIMTKYDVWKEGDAPIYMNDSKG